MNLDWLWLVLARKHQISVDPAHLGKLGDQFKGVARKGIKKRYYMFAGGYDYGPWTRNYLVVIDEHNQLYGFMMGYSE